MSPLDGRSVKEFAIMFKATLGGHTREEAPWGSRTGSCLPSGFQGLSARKVVWGRYGLVAGYVLLGL